MFNRIIGYYNRNRKVIWRIIAVIATIIIAIQLANFIAKEINKKEFGSSNNTLSKYVLQSEPAVGGGKLSTDEATKNNQLIDNFVEACNTGEISKAYSLITDECKERFFQTEEEFDENYYSKIFTQEKKCEKSNWFSTSSYTTYLIDYTNDVLLDGGYKDDENYTDFVTVVNKDDERKMNLFGLISSKILAKSYSDDYVDLVVKKVEQYMDYQLYDISIVNKTNTEITLLPKEDTWYVEDEKSKKYYTVISDFPPSIEKIEANSLREGYIKIPKAYNPEKVDESINFTSIAVNETKTIDIKIKLK